MLADRAHRRQRGFGLIEIMVGVLIGLLSVLVIYQVYNVAEGFKRNTTSVGEAQQTGLMSTFVLGMELGNAGAGISVSGVGASGQVLAACPDTGNIATSFRPIPVLITDGTAPATPDSFVVNYSLATTLVTPAAFFAAAISGAPYLVDSPGGFHVGDLVVGIDTATALCVSSVVTAVSVPNAVGVVSVTHTGAQAFPATAQLFNLGPVSRAQKVRYSVVNGVLFSAPLLDANGAALPTPVCPSAQCNPLASNIVNMKVEYGISTGQDAQGLLNTWVQATLGGGWDAATLLPAQITTINRIKAVRIGLIVQGEQFDKTLGAYNWVLFDCPAANNTCPGRLTGNIPAVAPTGNWRYRTYETVIPLRNEIWNLTQ
jgi:type IV pilus assembly protein PilW